MPVESPTSAGDGPPTTFEAPGMTTSLDDRGGQLLQKVELFFSSPEFSGEIGDFMRAHVDVFTQGFDLSAEQPLEYWQVFERYRDMIEAKVGAILKAERMMPEDLYNACERARSVDGAGTCMCLDYLLACAEYENFIRLVADFVSMQQWSLADGADGADDGGALGGDMADDDDPFAALEGHAVVESTADVELDETLPALGPPPARGGGGGAAYYDDDADADLRAEFAACAKVSVGDDAAARASSKYVPVDPDAADGGMSPTASGEAKAQAKADGGGGGGGGGAKAQYKLASAKSGGVADDGADDDDMF